MNTLITRFCELVVATSSHPSVSQASLESPIYDSLVLSRFKGSKVLDIGGGCGFPAVVYAIENPTIPIYFSEMNSMKARFVQGVATELGLTNLTVLPVPSEESNFDLVISRMLGSLPDLMFHAKPFLRKDGVVVTLSFDYENLFPYVDDIGGQFTSTLLPSTTFGDRRIYVCRSSL